MCKKEHYKKEIYELKIATQNIKEKFNKDMRNLRKKSNGNPGNKKSL
jgi:hypothetical protein